MSSELCPVEDCSKCPKNYLVELRPYTDTGEEGKITTTEQEKVFVYLFNKVLGKIAHSKDFPNGFCFRVRKATLPSNESLHSSV